MKSDSAPEFDALQTLLANAFAIQESGITASHLANLVELQHSIEAGDFNVCDVMHNIADRAQSVAGASGTAIASLEADQLVYQAAAGSVASYLGRRVIATLTTSTPQEPGTEILRVEDADADPRLQAAICRQFEAKSLLMLPVLCDHKLWGVLQIFFNQPHKFTDAEVRIYHILRNLLADAIAVPLERFQIAQPLPIDAAPGPQNSPSVAIDQSTAFDQDVPSFASPDSESTIPLNSGLPAQPSYGSPQARSFQLGRDDERSHCEDGELPPSISRAAPDSVPASSFIFYRRMWDVAVGAVAIITVSVLFLHQSQTLAIPASPASNVQAISSSEAENATHDTQSQPQSMESEETIPHAAKRVLGSASSAALKSLPARVHHFGSDATIRYFTPTPVILRSSSDSPKVRHLSDDVTIRYFIPAQQ